MDKSYNPTISIIIPVYNCEKFIQRCYDSIYNQTYQNWEAIFINDGSTDNTQSILLDIATKDSRVHIISQKNGGPSSARNTGLKAATAEYITMLDADDTMDPEMIEKLYNAAIQSKSDLITVGLIHSSDTGQITKCCIPYSGELNMSAKLLFRHIHRGPCAKLYKKSIIDKYNIKFPEKLKIAEDFVFIGMYASQIKTFYNIPKCLYRYCFGDNANSLLHLYGQDKYSFSSHLRHINTPWMICKYIIANVRDDDKIKEWAYESYRESLKMYHPIFHIIKSPKNKQLMKSYFKKQLRNFNKYVPLHMRLFTPYKFPALINIYKFFKNKLYVLMKRRQK